MDFLTHSGRDLLDPKTLLGAAAWAVLFVAAATILAFLVRGAARRLERRLSDVTGLRFASAFVQVLAYLLAFILRVAAGDRLHRAWCEAVGIPPHLRGRA
jgi:hypothetical protein